MPKRRGGAGRPFKPKPGPKITPVNNVGISDALLNDYVKELLEPTEFYNAYLSLPQHNKDLFIATLKKGLFTVADRRGADTKLLFLGEYGDVRGVNLTFSFESLVKNPKKYLTGLPKSYLQQVIQQSDIEREVERQVVLELLAKDVADPTLTNKPHFVRSTNGGDARLLEKRNITLSNGGIRVIQGGQGLEGISTYKDLSDTAVNFVNNAQVFIVRSMGENGFTDKSHYLLAEEAVYSAAALAAEQAGRKAGTVWGSPTIANDLRAMLRDPGIDPVIKSTFTSFLDDPDFDKMFDASRYISSPAVARKLSLKEVLNTPNLDIDHVDFYSLGKSLDGIAGGKIGGSAEFANYVATKISPNATSWGFSSQQAVDNLFATYSSKQLAFWEAGGFKDDIFTLFSKGTGAGFTYADYSLFKNMLQDINVRAVEARGVIRDSIESKLLAMGDNFINDYVDKFNLPAGIGDAYKQKVKERLKKVHSWKSYIHIRSEMEQQEEFFEALSKGELWKVYFYSSDYNRYLPGFLQDINTKLTKTKFINYRGGKVSIDDLLTGVNYYRDKSMGWIGFSGSDATANRRLFSLRNRSAFTPADFAIQNNEKLLLDFGSGKFISGGAFSANAIHDDVITAREAFNQNFNVLKTGDILVMAKDLDFASDLYEAYKELNEIYLMGSFAKIKDLDVLFAGIKNGTIPFDNAFGYLRGTDFAKYTKIQNALNKYFAYVDIKGINNTEMASFGIVLMNKFTDKGKLLKYTSLLAGVGERLSNMQNYVFAFLGDKVLANTIFKLPGIGKGAKWFWDNTYNPRYGSIQMALKIKNFFANNFVGKAFSSFMSSPLGVGLKAMLSKLLPAFLTTATAGMAYLAMVVERVARGFMWSIWHAFRGRFDLILKDYANIIDDLVVTPVKMVSKIVIRLTIAFCLLIAFILMMVMMAFSQNGRPEGGEFYTEEVPLYTDADGNLCAELSDTNPGLRLDSSNFDGSLISQSFNLTSCPGWSEERTDFHKGVDFKYTRGSSVYNPFKGSAKVVAVGNSTTDTSGFGTYVKVLKEIDGVKTYLILAHLESANVSVGDTVTSGQELGKSDSTGYSTGDHLHFEIRTGNGTIEEAENPCTVLDCGDCATTAFSGGICNKKP